MKPQTGYKSPAPGLTRGLGERRPPRNEEIEMALLGALLRNNRALDKVLDRTSLAPEHFFAPEHQRIFEMICHAVQNGREARPTTLAHLADGDPMLRDVDGADYLFSLAANVVTVINADDYAKTIVDHYLKRELIGLGEELVNEAYDLTQDRSAEQLSEGLEASLYSLMESRIHENHSASLGDAAYEALIDAEKAYKLSGQLIGVTSGLAGIDDMTGGFHPSDLIILAGRPAMGKTALATTIAHNAAKAYRCSEDDHGNELTEGGKTAFFSLEMKNSQLAMRIMAAGAGLSTDKIRRGEIDEEDFRRLAQERETLKNLPLILDQKGGRSVESLCAQARRYKREHNINLVVVDYLQLLHSDERAETRTQEVTKITGKLKALAKELDVPVIALSQLSRQVENREDKRPQLADLRESGSIEQDADMVCFVYRPEYYLEKDHPEQRVKESRDQFIDRQEDHKRRLAESRGLAEFIIAKQRHGPVGTVELAFEQDRTRFSDLKR